jgi:hypothetical protein
MKALTVRELIERLQEIDDQDLPVGFQYNYGDHWRTQVVADVTEADEMEVVHSGYHQMNKIADDDRDAEGAELTMMVVLG